jgi:hypothetical protein
VSQASPSLSQDYTIAKANADSDREKILELWKSGLTHAGMPEAKFDWYYRHNPAGAPLVFFLCHGPERKPIGVAAMALRELHWRGQTVLSGELVDFVARPEHRTLFPALFFQKEMRRIALEGADEHQPTAANNGDRISTESCEILYGLPNPKSLPVVKRVGYQLIGQIVRRVRMLRTAGYLSRHAPAWICHLAGPIIDHARLAAIAARNIGNRHLEPQWLAAPDDRFDALWQRVAAHHDQQSAATSVLIGVRDRAFLTWRFAQCPLRQYRFFTLVSRADRRLIAYAACSPDGETLYVHDFLVDPTEHSASKTLWLKLSREAFYEGHTNISVEFLGVRAQQRQLENVGLVARQQRPVFASIANTTEMIATSTPPASSERLAWLQEQYWYMTCADEDG